MSDHALLIQVLWYLAAMVVSVPLTKRFGLGAIIGYLIAGVVMGPFGFKLISESRETAQKFSEFGVIMMLLLIGLELNPRVLWKLRLPIFGLGGLQVVGTAAVVALGARAVGLEWAPAVALGLILAMSSTTIVLQTLEEKGLRRSAVGESVFSVLLFQDIAVIPILALLPLLGVQSTVESAPTPWLRGGLIFGAVALVVLAGRFLIRPLFRFIAHSHLRELFTAAALLLVLGITALMETVGLSPALGAFLAGVVLADSEYRHQIETDIEPFKGMLLGVFFISVGAGINFSVARQSPGPVLAVLGTLIFGKAIVVYLVAQVARLCRPNDYLFALSLAQGGEFAFVLLALVSSGGLFSEALTQTVGISVALSMALTPLILGGYLKWIEPRFRRTDERLADEIEERDNPVIVVGIGRIGQVIVRLLRSSGFACTVLDYDAEQVDIMRKFGQKSYFGDASRIELLEAAGAKQARFLVLALDDAEKTLEIIQLAQTHFPQLKIFARAYDRLHAYKIIHQGVNDVYIETAGTAFLMGEEVLAALGYGANRAHRAVKLFKHTNRESIFKLAKIYHEKDEASLISASQAAAAALEQVLRVDRDDAASAPQDHAWETPAR